MVAITALVAASLTAVVAWLGDAGLEISPDPSLPATVAAIDSAETRTAAPTPAPEGSSPSAATEDSVWNRFLALHDSALRASDEDAPLLLWAAGRLAASELRELEGRVGYREGRHLRYEGLMPGLFIRDEPNGTMAYTGWHFREIERRFPAHELADDAGLEVVGLPLFGECEEDFACYFEHWIGPLTRFVLAHPNSEYAPAAVDTVSDRLVSMFGDVAKGPRSLRAPDDIGVDSLDYYTISTDSLLAVYRRAIDGLPEPLRASALSRFTPINARWRARRRN